MLTRPDFARLVIPFKAVPVAPADLPVPAPTWFVADAFFQAKDGTLYAVTLADEEVYYHDTELGSWLGLESECPDEDEACPDSE